MQRDDFAQLIASEILTVERSNGHVMAIVGPWGSGKTSVINLVKTHLKDESCQLVDFNPWLISGTGELIDGLFGEIIACLDSKGTKYNKAVDSILNYVELLQPLSVVPIASKLVKPVLAVNTIVKKRRELRKKSLSGQKNKVSELLRKIDNPIIVFIDDIDRLTRQEIREIFKLVRLTANFPNIVYILAFDRLRVEKALTEDNDDFSGRAYLEKIVQSSFELPVLPFGLLDDQLAKALVDVVNDVDSFGLERFDRDAWLDIMQEIVMPLIHNMRDIRRLMMTLRPTIRAVGDQVEFSDIVALESLRLFLPDVFVKMIVFQASLTTVAPLYVTAGDEPSSLKEGIKAILERSSSHLDVVKACLRRLFPASVRHFEKYHYGTNFQSEWLRNRRVAHPDVLRFYLERLLPRGLEAVIHAEHLRLKMNSYSSFSSLLQTIEPDRRIDAIGHLGETADSFSVGEAAVCVTSIFNALPLLPEKTMETIFSLRPESIVTRTALGVLRKVENDDMGKANGIQAAVIESFSRIDSLCSRVELILLAGHLEGRGKKLIDEESSQRHQELLEDAIMNATSDELVKERRLVWLLRAPSLWGSEKLRIIEIEAPASLHFAIFRSAIGENKSQTVGNRRIRTTKALAWEELAEIYGGEQNLESSFEVMEADPEPDSEELLNLVRAEIVAHAPSIDGLASD